MKFTLAFGIHNKATWLAELMTSWLDRLTNRHRYEVIVVCDACTDESASIACHTMKAYPHIDYIPLETDDIFEIAVNNVALQHAAEASDLILFIQDDNWMHDIEWDRTLAQVIQASEHVGAIGLLAGVNFDTNLKRQRIEVNRPYKAKYFDRHGIDSYPLAVYEVDTVIRPFAVSTPLLRQYGGLGPGFDLIVWDDIELSLRLLRDGYRNLYVPFDVVNTSEIAGTMDQDRWRRSFAYNEQQTMKAHGAWLREREAPVLKRLPGLRKGQITAPGGGTDTRAVPVVEWLTFERPEVKGKKP
jgi:GT2 family glycosyltransferase